MENEEQKDMDSIEFYLRTLRKKVDHQLKNPFQLAFSSYTFEELLNWKNNVLQLDATSRLYGQRVDFLHTGTLHILGSVVNIEQKPQQSSEKKENIKEQGKQSIAENVFEKHLQNPERLNGLPTASDSNFLQWRQIMRKRDTLPLLMLNQLSMTTSLMLTLVSGKEEPHVYESVFGQESIYLKMINFSFLDPERCLILTEMQEVISDTDYFLMNIGREKKEHPRDAFNIDSYMEFDFPLIDQSKKEGFLSAERQQNRAQTSLMHDDFQCQYENPEGIMDNEPSEMGEYQSQVFSLYSIDTQTTKTAKERKPIMKKKSKKKRDLQKWEYIQFAGINPNREDVLAISQPPEDLFLTHKDHLHLRFIRYNPLFNLRIRNRGRKSLIRPSFNLLNNEASKMPFDCSFQSQDPYQFNTPLLIGNFSSVLSKKNQFKFKEAPLPLKQLKKKIREVGIDKEIRLSEIRAAFQNEDPLDIFISVLHIAAEDGLMIIK